MNMLLSLNMPCDKNMPGFCICEDTQGFEYA